MTDVYMAYSTGGNVALRMWDWADKPLNVLVALPYLSSWDKNAAENGYSPGKLMLDSGAFSAWKSGHVVDIDNLIALTLSGRFDEAVGLDVIGSWEGSRRNIDYMRERGSDAMPVFHIGDPWELLEYYCAGWSKVGLSCRFGEGRPTSIRFYEQCFARCWPHRFHSFGWIDFAMLRAFPFHSGDAVTWGGGERWRRFVYNAEVVNIPGVSNDVCRRGNVMALQFYWDMQCYLKVRWSREISMLEGVDGRKEGFSARAEG